MEIVLTDEQIFAQYESYVYELTKIIKEQTRKSMGLVSYIKEGGRYKVDNSDLFQMGREVLWNAIKEYPKFLERRRKENIEIEAYNKKILEENEKAGITLCEPKELKKIGGISTFIYLRLKSQFINHNATLNQQKNMGKEIPLPKGFDHGIESCPEVLADFNREFEKLSLDTQKLIKHYFTTGDSVATIKRFYGENCQTEINKFRSKMLKMEEN